MWDSTEELHIQQRSSASPLSGTLKQRSISVRCGLEATLSALVLALLGPFAALRARSVQKLLLGIVVLDVPLQLGTHFFYREADASSGALGGLSISVTTIALLAYIRRGSFEGWSGEGKKLAHRHNGTGR